MVTIRNASLKDAAKLLSIYAHYVTDTAVSFEYDAPTLPEFERRMRDVTAFYPFLVLEADGKTAGYAYAHAFHPREAYRRCCEVTVYLSPDERHKGFGRLLYEALEEALREMGILNLYACIAVPETEDAYLTNDSAAFHTHMGYRQAGVFRNCGFKFGRWYDMIWMEKTLGPHTDDPAPVHPYMQTAAAEKYKRGVMLPDQTSQTKEEDANGIG